MDNNNNNSPFASSMNKFILKINLSRSFFSFPLEKLMYMRM